VPVVNLSLGGACIATSPGASSVELTIEHPHLPETASLRAEVVWSRPSQGKPQAGVRFLEPGPAERTLLRRCMLAEYGHAVWATPYADRPVGYVVPTSDDAWGMFDQGVRQVGTLRREGALLFLRVQGADTDVIVPGFAEAAGRAFGLPRAPRIHPAIEAQPGLTITSPVGPAPSALPTLHGSTVHDAGRAVGYVAKVKESWSFFDPRREPMGFMTRAESGAWNVVILGADEDSEVVVKSAASYPDAIAAAFSLAQPPDLRSVVFKPARLLDE
jgi:hypothetical protein